MAKQIKSADNKRIRKEWSERELIRTFNLVRLVNAPTVEMQEWLDVEPPILNIGEKYMFDEDLNNAQKYISGWNEEDLKMKFISNIIKLGNLKDSDNIMGYFDKTISATVENIHLTVKSDFMLAKGTLDFLKRHIFIFKHTNLTKILRAIRWRSF